MTGFNLLKSRGGIYALCLAGLLASGAATAQGPMQLAPASPASAPKAAPAAQPAATPAKPAAARPAAQAPAPAQNHTAANSVLDQAQQATLRKITEVYNTVREMQGDFLQIEPDGTRTTGKFYLTKPGKVRFQYDRPTPIEIVSDGDSVVVRDRKLNTQDLYPLSQTPLRYLLRDKIDLMKDAKVLSVYQDADLVMVTIEEKATFTSGQLTLYFGGTDYALRQWTITDAKGLETAVKVSNVATDKTNSASLFRIDYTRMGGPGNSAN